MEPLHLNISSGDKPADKVCGNENCHGKIEAIKLAMGWWFPRICRNCSDIESKSFIAEEEASKVKLAIKRLNLPPRFAQANFENFKKELQPAAYLAASGFAENYTQKTFRGLYLFGHAGSGKTHLAASIGNKLVLQPGVRFITAPELLLGIRKTFSDAGGDDGLLDRLSQTKLLIIDDLGSEKPTEWVQETVFVLIDRRYTSYLPTIITSNYSLDQLKDRLGYRIASRIAEVSEMVELRPNDYRISKH